MSADRPHFKPNEADIEDGKTDCYWCGRTFPITEMKKERKYDIIVYICKDCE